MEIINASNAKDVVLMWLKKNRNYKWRNVVPINLGRYWLVEGGNGHPTIAVTFKKDWFYKFGEFAVTHNWVNDKERIETGIGDTVNKDDLRIMLANKVEYLYCIHVSGAIYYIPISEFITKSHSWTNKEAKEVRSISIHNYMRLNEV